jgi:hypothetical protein
MFSKNGNCEENIVRFSGIPSDVSYTGENIVAVTIYDKPAGNIDPINQFTIRV